MMRLLLLPLFLVALGQTCVTDQSKGLNRGLALALERMVKVDQEVRGELTRAIASGDNQKLPALARRMSEIDRYNTNQMQQIIKTYGWPTVKLVGQQGAQNAWLLVQHADHNPAFQRECLDLMQPLLASEQVSKQNFAYLTDRVLLAEGKKQMYGTQFQQNAKGEWEPKPIEDPENVDKRRLAMGLNTLAEYRKMIEAMYGKKPTG